MLLLCCSALPCCASCLVFSLRSCALLWVQKAKKRTARGPKEAAGEVQNDPKTLPKSSQNPPKMAPGSLPGSLRRPLGAIWRRRWLPGALRGPSEVFLAPLGSLLAPLGALLGCSWRLLGRSGGVPGTPLGVILASLGCFLQGRLKNDPRSLKRQQHNLIFKDRFVTLFELFVDPLSSRKLLGET